MILAYIHCYSVRITIVVKRFAFFKFAGIATEAVVEKLTACHRLNLAKFWVHYLTVESQIASLKYNHFFFQSGRPRLVIGS